MRLFSGGKSASGFLSGEAGGSFYNAMLARQSLVYWHSPGGAPAPLGLPLLWASGPRGLGLTGGGSRPPPWKIHRNFDRNSTSILCSWTDSFKLHHFIDHPIIDRPCIHHPIHRPSIHHSIDRRSIHRQPIHLKIVVVGCLLACLLACLPACLLACLLACSCLLPARPPAACSSAPPPSPVSWIL